VVSLRTAMGHVASPGADHARPGQAGFLSRACASRAESWDERRRFWLSVCENGAASEVVVNLWLPWFLSDVRGGVLHAPSDFAVNSAVLVLNLASAWMEGFSKSTRLLTQCLRRSRTAHQAVFVLAHGFSLGFLNVSSSFPDVGGGASDAALAVGSSVPGLLYILANLLGSLWFYKLGRSAGWRAVQRHWSGVLAFCRVWPFVVRGSLLASFVFVFVGPGSMGHDVPLDLGDPDIGGIESVRLVYDEYVIHLPAQPLGLAFGIAMSILGCVAAAACSEFWPAEQQRSAARLAANFTSTAMVLIVQQMQTFWDPPSFMLMKFGSSFCGAFSAFSSTMGDIFDEVFGAPEELTPFSDPLELQGVAPPVKEKATDPCCIAALTGAQNFTLHCLLTVSIMLLGVYTGPVPAPPILLRSQPREPLQGAFARAFDPAGTASAGLFGNEEA